MNNDVTTFEWFVVSKSTDEIVWRVRFYLTSQSEWLKVGDKSGDLPLMKVDAAGLAGASVTVSAAVDGNVPEKAVPVNSVLLAAQAAATAAEEVRECREAMLALFLFYFWLF